MPSVAAVVTLVFLPVAKASAFADKGLWKAFRRDSSRMLSVAAVVALVFLPVAQASADIQQLLDDTWEQDSKLVGHPISRIYGGTPIGANDQFQYASASLVQSGSQHQCGATFVAPDVLLTAAHCYHWFDTIRIAEHNRVATRGRSASNRHPYAQVIRHPHFKNETFENDIMVIRLKKAVEDATIIRMNKMDQIPVRNQALTVVGWGAIAGQHDFPGVLHYAQVPYIERNLCENTVYQGRQLYKGEIFSTMLCAGGDGVDACRGDSGSPLVIPSADGDLLVGLVSWGRGCAIYPGVYSRMSSFYDWARTHICYLSSNPPEYLACKTNERGPYTQQSPSTVPAPGGPTASPSVFRETVKKDFNSSTTNDALVDPDPLVLRNRTELSSGTQYLCTSYAFRVLGLTLMALQLSL